MANKYANTSGKGFTPQRSAQPPQEPEILQTNTRKVIQSALTTSATHLQQLEAGMDLVSDQFADRAVAIVKEGIQTCYSKASDRISALEVEDFFALGEVASMFESYILPNTTNAAVLPGTIDVA